MRPLVRAVNKNAKIFVRVTAAVEDPEQGPVGVNARKKAIPVQLVQVDAGFLTQRAVKPAGKLVARKVTRAQHVPAAVIQIPVVAVRLVGIVVGKKDTQVRRVLHVAESTLQRAVALAGLSARKRVTRAQLVQVVAVLISKSQAKNKKKSRGYIQGSFFCRSLVAILSETFFNDLVNLGEAMA